ncbi:MAG TPA: hypothetical protein VMU45_12305 [Candidatus Eisenbacteria bacterium]|nr:hypothetical protein [Candidatus Eisenbacteria bacterium]
MTTPPANRTGIAKLWLLNFVANAVLLAVWYFWLLIPDAHIWQVAGSAVIAVVTVALVLWLRSGTLAWFRVNVFREEGTIWPAYRHSLRHVPALGIWVLVFVLLGWMVWSLRDYVPQFAVWIRQKLGAGPPPRNILNDLNWLLLVIVGFVMPGLWVPIATTVSTVGFRPEHIVLSRRVWKKPLYWLWFCLLLGFGIYIPYRLVWWIPDLQTLRQQVWSMGARFLLAYAIAVTAFIAVVWMTAVHTDREDPVVL